MTLPSDTLRRAVVGPDGRSWILELRDGGFSSLRNHFFLALLLKRLRRSPGWRAVLVDAGGQSVATFESSDPSAAKTWVADMAERIEAGLEPTADAT